MNRTLFVVAGEASGDERGAALISHLKQMDPSLEIVGLGGNKMAGAGCQILFDLPSMATLGFTDVLKTYCSFRRVFYQTIRQIEDYKPAAVILIDFPGFNIRLAKKIHGRCPVIYYVSPQIWAWAPHRKHTIARHVDKMLALFKFEQEVYRGTSLDIEWVGHPLVDNLAHAPSKDEARKFLKLDSRSTVVGLLPGSREKEVCRILPIMLKAAQIIGKECPETTFVIGESENVDPELIGRLVREYTDLSIIVSKGPSERVFRAGDFALVCSGTATLEAALLGTPFLIVYKTAYLTYLFARNLMQIPYIGMVNVLAGRAIVPEFIQHDARAVPIAECALRYLRNPHARSEMTAAFSAVLEKELGQPGVSARTARAVIQFLEETSVRGESSTAGSC